jgi:anaerobic magnesium-protoporphyrin IX monomethyl ester cyclase
VTPIIQPDGMTREQVLKGVLRNYARFYMRKTFFSYPWLRDTFKRRYMLGCLKAFAKTTATKKFYDLERLKFNGVTTRVDLGFDETKVLRKDQIAAQKLNLSADIDYVGTFGRGDGHPDRVLRGDTGPILACGAPNHLHVPEEADDAD